MQSKPDDENDHGFAVYQKIFSKAQKGFASAEAKHESPKPERPRRDDSQPETPSYEKADRANNYHFGDSEDDSYSSQSETPALGSKEELFLAAQAVEEATPSASSNGRNESSMPETDINRHPERIIEVEDDDYSEAERRFTANQARRGRPTWYRKRQGDDSDSDKGDIKARDPQNDEYDSDLVSDASDTKNHVVREHAKKMRKWQAQASNRFENMLLECIVNIDSIPPRYENIFIARGVIRELERVTRLCLDRPKAFEKGVLKGNRVTGAVLYGPPGTGKTLLVKGLAKESCCNMLSVSTAELWQKCHGDDEKVIKALFSLGRKIHPCIIFLDEADAMLGARKAGEKRHIRSMINQFLMEWDGLMSGIHSPFILLATNRPFDLDPAVLRRAPVHIHLDVPTVREREGILGQLLKGEKLAPGLDVATLARYTHKYTGSDLKSLCVTAATICVGRQQEDTEVRVLTKDHFARAMKTVRPTTMGNTMKNEFQKFEKKNAAQLEVGHGNHDEDDD